MRYFPFALALLAFPASGQDLQLPSPQPLAEYSACLVADIDDDQQDDIVLLESSGRVDVAMGFGRYEAFIEDVFDVANHPMEDLAILPGASGDQIVAVGSTGLLLSNWNAGALTFGAPTVVTQGSFWSAAVKVEVLQDGSHPSLVGVKSDLRTIRRRRWDGAAWVDELVGTMAQDVLDLGAVDTEGDGTDELTVLMTNSFQIRDLAASQVYAFTALGAKLLATVRHADGGLREQAVVISQLGVTWFCAVYGRTQATPSAAAPVLAGWSVMGDHLDLAGVTSADFGSPGGNSADGLDDLVVNSNSTNTVAYLWNTGTQTVGAFDMINESVLATYAAATLTAVADPCALEADGDGDPDLAQYDNTGHSLNLLVNGDIDQDQIRPEVISAFLDVDGTGMVWVDAVVDFPGAAFLDPDWLCEFVIYTHDGLQPGGLTSTPHASEHIELSDLSRVTPVSATASFHVNVRLPLDPTSNPGTQCGKVDSVYALVARCVQADTARTTIEARGVSVTSLFQADYGDFSNAVFVGNFASGGDGVGTTPMAAVCIGEGRIGEVGSIGPGPCLPGPPIGGGTPGKPIYP